MHEYLVFTLSAAMAAMGDLAGHERRGTLAWPGRSAVLAAAKDIRCDDAQALARLEPSRVAVGVFDAGEPLRDYHTVQTVPSAAATRKTAADPRARGARVDVVMDAIHALPLGKASGDRRAARMDAAQKAGCQWLEQQGAKAGFAVPEAAVSDYSVIPLPAHSGSRARQPQFGVLELSGQIEVTDPALLLDGLGKGFGRAKAFGCGLMLVRRA